MADLSSPPSSGAPLAAAWSREAAEGLVARWCDALLARQIAGTGDPMLDGAIACPACGVLHGRVGDRLPRALCGRVARPTNLCLA